MRVTIIPSLAEDVISSVGTLEGIDVKTNGFCKSCNSGWMSQLEMDTNPVLKPLILGQAGQLDRAAQALLARWAWKTTLTVDVAVRMSRQRVRKEGIPREITVQHPPIPAEEYTKFCENQIPPAEALVWLGAYKGSRLAHGARSTHWLCFRPLPSGSPHLFSVPPGHEITLKARYFVVTLSLGQVLFRIIGPGNYGDLRPGSIRQKG